MKELFSRLGEPDDWMKENITNMKEILFYLPTDTLMMIEDDNAIKEV